MGHLDCPAFAAGRGLADRFCSIVLARERHSRFPSVAVPSADCLAHGPIARPANRSAPCPWNCRSSFRLAHGPLRKAQPCKCAGHRFSAGTRGRQHWRDRRGDLYRGSLSAGSGLRVGLDQIARLYAEAANSERFAICKSHAEILRARETGKIALLITMEGVEPLGTDLDLLRVFYELGVRVIGLTHARRNAAGDGGVFAPTGSSPEGLTAFGRDRGARMRSARGDCRSCAYQSGRL